MEDRRICDYFLIAGLPSPSKRVKEIDLEPSQSPQHKHQNDQAPITDITIIRTEYEEEVPDEYFCIEETPNNFCADLNHGSLSTPSIYLCYRRGTDKPPLTDIGVFYESKDVLMPDSNIVRESFYGNDGNVNNGNSKIFLTYRRAKPDAPCNQLVVKDICVILKSKGESPPHAFNLINKNLNKGLIGSDVYICYKKSLFSPPLLRYTPAIIDRYPKEDLECYELPKQIAMFCLPLGSTIECWPKENTKILPLLSNFVLTGELGVKVYCSALNFYENFQLDELDSLSNADLKRLNYFSGFNQINKKLVVNRSICLVSRWPFFDLFENFLNFLYKSVFRSFKNPLNLPIEVYISHFMMNIPFPSIQRPKICIQLSQLEEDQLMISNPLDETPLPLSGASYVNFLQTLGADNCMDVFLYALTEQKILLHSLRLDVLTSVAEALISLIFPFHWECSYIPVCPFELWGVLNAPIPFIVGLDSRYFDTELPPSDLICIDLDTRSIYMNETKRNLNIKLVPKKAYKNLKKTLDVIALKLNTKMMEMKQEKPSISFSQISKKLEKDFGVEIQEAFLQFMTFILKDFRNYLIPFKTRPTEVSKDPTSLFDFNGFINSKDKSSHQFYKLLLYTQMFCRFIEERTGAPSNKQTPSLAFFDECLTRIENLETPDSSTFQFIELDRDKNDRTVFISDPESLVNLENYQPPYKYVKFGPFNHELFLKEPILSHFDNYRKPSIESRLFESVNSGNRSNSINLLNQQDNASTSSPMMIRRTKHEIKTSQRVAKRLAETPLTWSKCLVSYCYSLWFVHLHSYIKANQQASLKAKLKEAFGILLRMQSLDLHPLDEVCYRILILLSGIYSQPILAVKILTEMKKNKVTPNCITYNYYCNAVLESDWKLETNENVFWKKLRHLVNACAQFKISGKLFAKRQNKAYKENELETPDCNKNGSTSTLISLDKHDSLFSRQHNKSSSFRNKKLNKKLTLFNEKLNKKSSIVKGFNSTNQHNLINYSTEAGILINYNELQMKNERKQFDRRRHKSEEKSDQNLFNLNKLKEELTNVPSSAIYSKVYLKKEMPRSQSLSVYKSKSGNNFTSNDVIVETILEVSQNHSRKSSTSSQNDNEKRRLSELPRKSDTSSTNDKSESTNCSNENIDNNLQSTESLDSENSTFSPLRDAIKNMNPFFSENKVASTLRSSFRLTKSFAKNQFANSSLFRSSLSKQNSNPVEIQSEASVNDKSIKPENASSNENLKENSNNDVKCSMTRSSTLPLSISSDASNGSENDSKNSNIENEATSEMVKSHSSTDFNSIWPTKFNTNNQYLSSTFKFATNTMNRLSEIKSTLSASSNTSSPSKPTSVTLATTSVPTSSQNQPAPTSQNNAFIQNTSALLTNIASMVADKLPANVGQFNELYDYYMFNTDWPDGSEASTKNQADAFINDKFFVTLEEQYKSNSNKDLAENEINLLKIEITSCTKCYDCSAILYDEELMGAWSPDHSNLNTSCRYCEKLLVPKLTIKVKFNEKLLSSNENLENDLIDSNADDESFTDYKKISVAYLCPIVLRKELENVVDNEGDFCLTDTQFILEHDIIYWNLLWWLLRTNLPTHLTGLYLTQFLKEKSMEHLSTKFDAKNVNVVCLWDNEDLFDDIPKPLYQFYRKSYSKNEETSSLVSALVTEKEKNVNKLIFTVLLDHIYKSNLLDAIKVFIENRKKPKQRKAKYLYSIYRDLLYLLFAAVDNPASIDNICFDRAYRHAYDQLTEEETELMRITDKPPSLKATFCRRSFKQLGLKVKS